LLFFSSSRGIGLAMARDGLPVIGLTVNNR
jgi:hypothetical protein